MRAITGPASGVVTSVRDMPRESPAAVAVAVITGSAPALALTIAPEVRTSACGPVPTSWIPSPPPMTDAAPLRAHEVAPTHPARAPRLEAEPLTGELRRLHLTVSAAFLGKLEAARVGLSHSSPRAGAEEGLEAALDLQRAAEELLGQGVMMGARRRRGGGV